MGRSSLSLRTKLFLGGLALVLIPLMAVGLNAYYTSSNEMTESGRANAANLAQRVADMVQVAMQQEVKIVSGLASSPVARTAAAKYGQEGSLGEVQALGSMLKAFREAAGEDYETLFMADLQGTLFADALEGRTLNIKVGDRDYFQKAKAGQVAVGQVMLSKDSHKPVTVIAVPVKTTEGKVAAVLVAVLKIEFLSDKVRNTKSGQTGYAVLLGADAVTIAHPNPDYVLKLDVKKIAGMEKVTARLLEHQTGAESYVFNGTPKVAGFAPIHLTGWSVLVTQDTDEFMKGAHKIRNEVAIIAALALVISGFLSIFLAQGITKPLKRVIAGLADGSAQVGAAAAQVNTSGQTLASGASEQAAALEETSSSLEEMSSMTKTNAENANQANSLMVEAKEVALRANQSMAELTAAMSEISKASEETGKIIKTIDEIAFQTNLLALNAAVEAARAGEAGAGFAVVADEVRNLAMRAAEAAKNTATLIEETINKAREGGTLVEQTSGILAEVSLGGHKVADLVAGISAASSEQAQGIDQINKAANEMDQVTQQTAATAEESAASAEELLAQAKGMEEFVADLVKLVEGAAANGRNGTPRKAARAQAPQRQALPEPAAARRVKRNAGQSFPFDEEENFRDF